MYQCLKVVVWPLIYSPQDTGQLPYQQAKSRFGNGGGLQLHKTPPDKKTADI